MIAINFINQLQLVIHDARKAGLNIGTSELEDALKSLALIAPEEWDLNTILTCTMIKSQGEQVLFQHLLRLHLGIGEPKPVESTNDTNGPSTEEGCCNSSGTGNGKAGVGMGSSDRQAQRHLVASLVKKLSPQLNWQQSEQEIVNQIMLLINYRETRYYLRKEHPGDPTIEADIKSFETLLENEVEYHCLKNAPLTKRDKLLASKDLRRVDFGSMTTTQVEQLQRIIKKLGKKLANKASYRYKKARKGKLDIVSTLKLSCGTRGLPLRLRFKSYRKDKPNLIVLCDLSGSVAPYVRFILHLIFEMQRLFTCIRTFAFVDSIMEVSNILDNSRSIDQAVQQLVNNKFFNKTGFSNYGTVIQDFNAKYTNVGDSKQILIVIGDGRSNYQKVHVDLWNTLFRRFRKAYWLNPLPRSAWDLDDCLAQVVFQPLVTAMYECRTLEQLEAIAKEIV